LFTNPGLSWIALILPAAAGCLPPFLAQDHDGRGFTLAELLTHPRRGFARKKLPVNLTGVILSLYDLERSIAHLGFCLTRNKEKARA